MSSVEFPIRTIGVSHPANVTETKRSVIDRRVIKLAVGLWNTELESIHIITGGHSSTDYRIARCDNLGQSKLSTIQSGIQLMVLGGFKTCSTNSLVSIHSSSIF